LFAIAALAAAEAQPERAVQLAGASAGVREAMGTSLLPMKRAMLAHWLVPLRQSFGAETTRLAWEDGRKMPEEQVLDLAFVVTEAPHERLDRPPDGLGEQPTVLSPREQEVAALLADGLSNRQIANRLVITERTVKAHIEHILDKLGFTSRTRIALWAAEHGLPARVPR
jgi:DNA-binding CsgD family transcriptional regulator